MTQFLRFTDADAWTAAAAGAGFIVNGVLDAYTHTHAIDLIGLIPNGDDVSTPPEMLPGWHVNYIGDLPTSWVPALVTPVQPYRVFA